jgi:hypothetical protein
MVDGIEEGLPVVLVDGLFNYCYQPMGRDSNNPCKFYWIDPSAHSDLRDAYGTMA